MESTPEAVISPFRGWDLSTHEGVKFGDTEKNNKPKVIFEKRLPVKSYTRFKHTPLGNPRVVEDQETVLSSIQVGDVSELMPSGYKDSVMRHMNGRGTVTYTLPDCSVVWLDANPNDIMSVRHLRLLTPPWFPIKINEILEYYFVDQKTGKAFDVFSLWAKPGEPEPSKASKKIKVFGIPQWLNAAFAPSGNREHFLILNRLSIDSPLGVKLSRDSELGPVFDVIDMLIPGHEAGHRWQFKDFYNEKAYPKTPRFMKIKSRFLPLVEFLFPHLGENIRSVLSTWKQHHVEQERNAHAFALSAFRRLKSLGIDLLRGKTNTDVIKAVEYTLESYEKSLGYLPGWPFGRRERAKFRKTGKHLI